MNNETIVRIVKYPDDLSTVRRQKEWQLSGPDLRYGLPPPSPCG